MKKPVVFYIFLSIALLYTPLLHAQSGIITTIAGNGTFGYSGDGGPATAAEMRSAISIAADGAGNIFFADIENSVVRKIDASGIISTFPGNGIALAVDTYGNLFIADQRNHAVRKVSPSGAIITVAGTGVPGFSGDGGPATDARLEGPNSVSFDGFGNLYISDPVRIRKVNPSGVITSVAGNGTWGFSGDGYAATDASLASYGIAADLRGNVYVVCEDRIRKVSASGIITTVAGDGIAGYSGDGGPATAARLWGPFGAATDNIGNLYITDYENGVIRKVNAAGIISTFAGNGGAYSGDGGPAIMAGIDNPYCITQNATGDFFIGNKGAPVIRKISSTLATDQINTPKNNISLSPNPNSGSFTIKGSLNSSITENVSLEIMNILGQAVYKTKVAAPNGTLNNQVSPDDQLPNGLYMLHIWSGNVNDVLRFVVEK